jgi:hypothetical protein
MEPFVVGRSPVALRSWEVTSGRLLSETTIPGVRGSATLSPDGQRVAFVDGFWLFVANTVTGGLLLTTTAGEDILRAGFGGEGRMLEPISKMSAEAKMEA